jgi:hypothetical protein
MTVTSFPACIRAPESSFRRAFRASLDTKFAATPSADCSESNDTARPERPFVRSWPGDHPQECPRSDLELADDKKGAGAVGLVYRYVDATVGAALLLTVGLAAADV